MSGPWPLNPMPYLAAHAVCTCLLLVLAGPGMAQDSAPGTPPVAPAEPPAAEAPETYQQTGKFPEETRDSDGDGVADIDDNCPDSKPRDAIVTPAGKFPVITDVCGCPKDPCACDSDADGVNDCQDLCPNTYRGHRVGEDGCPLPILENERVKLDVKFEFDKAAIQPGFEQDLLRMRALLLKYPEVSVTLEGHTDWKGSDTYNLKLSERRARVCRDFILAEPGIAPERVTAVGYGESKPIADNETETGMALNRRTVAELSGGRTIVPINDQPPPLEGLAPESSGDGEPAPTPPPPAEPR